MFKVLELKPKKSSLTEKKNEKIDGRRKEQIKEVVAECCDKKMCT
jgi:hypothetical protein